MAITVSDEVFEQLVDQALEQIPEELVNLIDNCVVVIEDDVPEGFEPMLGLYEGIPLTERDSGYDAALPDKITIFKNPLLRFVDSEEELVEEVIITVIHEIAHHFGIDEDVLEELGYQ